MATRSTIALELKDGRVRKIYCHWDGYLDHNGTILHNDYGNYDKIDQLTSMGDLSSLDSEIGENILSANALRGSVIFTLGIEVNLKVYPTFFTV